MVNGEAVYKLKFKRLNVFKNCKVIMSVNGEKVIVDIQKCIQERE